MALKKRSELAAPYDFRTWRDFTPMSVSVSTMLHNRTGGWRFIRPIYENKTPACQNACPAGCDIEGWVGLVQKKEYEKAFRHLKREEPFPAILGRVCFRFCEGACNREPLDANVNINALERFLGDLFPPETTFPDPPELNGKRMAVVGSGPAGMSAAYFGRLLGFDVAMFEVLPVMGGMLRVGIPGFRLPREVVEAEFRGLSNMGIALRAGVAAGKDLSMAHLRREFDYIFLATGGHSSLTLGLAGEKESPGIMSGLAMLKKAALGEAMDLGGRVVVIGGGNTAVDAARTAVRLGCETTILYRRSEEEMPAHPREVAEAGEEGVRLALLAAPERIELDDAGDVRKLICREMTLGAPDESGRRRPEKKDGALFEMEADAIVTAIGEAPGLDYLAGEVKTEQGMALVDDGLKALDEEGDGGKIFAGGDMIAMPRTVAHAVAAGKRAAISMDCDRKGLDAARVFSTITAGDGPALRFSAYMEWEPEDSASRNPRKVVGRDRIVYDYFRKAPAIRVETSDPASRKKTFQDYRRTYTEKEARAEAERCMHCGRCTECDNCLIFCPDMSVLPHDDGRFGYAIDYDYCKGCGICCTECPRNAITMIDEET